VPSRGAGWREIWSIVASEAQAELRERCARCLRANRCRCTTAGRASEGRQEDLGPEFSHQADLEGPPALLSYFSEITERKRAEEALRASEQRFSKAFHGSPLPMSIVTLEDGRYIDANASLLRMVGRTRAEIIGRSVADLNLWVNPAERTEMVRLVTEEASAKNYETRLRVKSGEIRDVLICAEVIELGQERCMIVVTQDVTERKRSEESLRQLGEQFRQSQKMEAVGRLAGGIAHDFNNLLTIIQGHATLLTEQDAPQMTRDAAQQISLAAERAGGLVRQLLTFSRRQVMQARNLDLNEVIDGTGKMLRRILGEDIELIFRLNPASRRCTPTAE